MTEEIKKEIKNTFYIDEDNMHFEVAEININTLFKILDKYKDQDKYKNAWEELKNTPAYYDEDSGTLTYGEEFSIIKELEEKHKIEVK